MKAVVWTKYGPPEVLQLKEVEKPVPKDNEVLIRIRAATATAGDCEMRSLKFPLFLSLPMRAYAGLTRPKRITIPGMDFAGEIESVGKNVKLYKQGDQVFASAGFKAGAYAEYKCMPEEPKDMEGLLAIKPANMSYEEAASVPTGGLEALHFLRKGNIRAGEKILINGAGGSIGTFAVQLARYYGAEVTAVDSTGKLDMLRSIGADQVLDYTREDFTVSAGRDSGGRASAGHVSAGCASAGCDSAGRASAGRDSVDRNTAGTYDIIFDVVGKSSFSRCMRLLKQNGRYLIANPGLSQMFQGRWASKRSDKKVVTEASSGTIEDLTALKELIEAGKINSVIDRRYPLEQTAEAHRYVETGAKKGNVVITVEHHSVS